MSGQYNIQNEIRVGKKRLETIEETYRKSRNKIEETYQSYIDVKDSLQHMVDESHEELFRVMGSLPGVYQRRITKKP